MGARFKTKTVTLTGAAQSLVDVLGLSSDSFFSSLTLRTPRNNVGELTWSDENGDAGGFLEPGDAANIDVTGKFIRADTFLLSGTAEDMVYITYIE